MNQNSNNYKLVKFEELQKIFKKLENDKDKNVNKIKSNKKTEKKNNELIKLPNIDYNNSSNKYKDKVKINNLNINNISM